MNTLKVWFIAALVAAGFLLIDSKTSNRDEQMQPANRTVTSNHLSLTS